MQISWHKTQSIVDRYDIVSEHDLRRRRGQAHELLRGAEIGPSGETQAGKMKPQSSPIQEFCILRKLLVRMIGLEPTLPRGNWNLNPARLPISPHPQFLLALV